jgi:hypothetical protein
MKMRNHFLDDVDVDVDEAFDFEPLRAVFPELGGTGFVGGVFVDWQWGSRGQWDEITCTNRRKLLTLIFKNPYMRFAKS